MSLKYELYINFKTVCDNKNSCMLKYNSMLKVLLKVQVESILYFLHIVFKSFRGYY